jgi:hypothetical protein
MLTGVLAMNSFAGIIVNNVSKEKQEPCSSEKTGIIVNGIIVNAIGIIVNGIIVNGIIITEKAPTCETNSRTGVMLAD